MKPLDIPAFNYLQAGRPIYIGELYRHHSGNVYKVLGFVTVDDVLMVRYEHVKDHKIYKWPFDSFIQEVDKNKFPFAKQKYMFEQITGDMSWQEQEQAVNGAITITAEEVGP
ncbi:MAG: DUF1653 domain-containing protein [Ruminococcus flavefaciens]|nr:DUF1653 domain-containing protein [Ruminococcus flavefaciens]